MEKSNNTEHSHIPFNRPAVVGRELEYISQVFDSGHLAGEGRFTRMCSEWMQREFDIPKALLTTSCTAALEICALIADIQPGDEVIMPSYAYVSTANPFVLRGAAIRFVDIRPDTLNLDENLVAGAVNDRTKAIVPVHYAAVACEMDAIMDIAARNEVLVIEDAAMGIDAEYKGRYLGTIGHLGAYSFHDTKNVVCGEGGALIINDKRFIDRAEIVRDKGTNRAQFLRGEVDRYTWVDVGSSYLPSEIQAAFLYAQLEETKKITRKRQKIHDIYVEEFTPLEERGLIRLPHPPPECRHNGHMFYLVMKDNASRDGLINFLKTREIDAVFHYIPLHLSSMGKRMGFRLGDLPVTEDLSDRIIRLPMYNELEQQQQERVVKAVEAFLLS